MEATSTSEREAGRRATAAVAAEAGSTSARRPGRLAAAAVVAAGLWVLTGALFKLLLGSPGDLPAVLREELPLDQVLVYRVAIQAELCVVSLALLRPRSAWPLVVLLLLVFHGVLFLQIQRGDASCGCFGASVQIEPETMLAIDAALLALVLVTRPWARPAAWAAHAAVVLVALLASLAAPFLFDRRVTEPTQGPVAALEGYAVLSPAKWIGKEIWDTELAPWIDTYALPQDGLCVFYRQTCEHCAKHLAALAEHDDGARPIALLRVPEDGDTPENRVVLVTPSGAHVSELSLPAGTIYAMTTPADFELEGGVVVRGREGIPVE